jgi:Tfp pilus assembly protein PilX
MGSGCRTRQFLPRTAGPGVIASASRAAGAASSGRRGWHACCCTVAMRLLLYVALLMLAARGVHAQPAVSTENRDAPEAQDPAQANPTDAERRTRDQLLAARVEDALRRDGAVPAMRMRIDVHGGVVALAGTVQREEDRTRAEQLVRNVEGVQRVQNDLQVQTPGTPEPGTSAIPERRAP